MIISVSTLSLFFFPFHQSLHPPYFPFPTFISFCFVLLSTKLLRDIYMTMSFRERMIHGLFGAEHPAITCSQHIQESGIFHIHAVCCKEVTVTETGTVALSYSILFCLVWLFSLRGLLFSEGKQRGSGSPGEGRWRVPEGVEGDETVVWMYFLRGEYNFNRKKRKKK